MSNAMDHFKGDQDPAVRTWQDATEASMAMSTSAQARRLTDELGQLRRDYNAILLERNVAWSQLARADQIIRDAHERAEQARAENERLTARLGGRARAYQLTDKGRAATEETHG